MLYTFSKDKLANYGTVLEDSNVVEYAESVISSILFSVVSKESQHNHVFGPCMEEDFIDRTIALIRESFPDSIVLKYNFSQLDEKILKSGFIISWA